MRVILASLIMSALFSAGFWNGAPMHRTGLLLVEAATVTIAENEGDSRLGGYDDAKGWYSSYCADSGFQLQDRVLSIYVYNPLNKAIDDVIMRYDWIIRKGAMCCEPEYH